MTISAITLLYNAPVPGSGADDWDVLDQVEAVEKALVELGLSVDRVAIGSDFMNEIARLKASGVTHVFNLTEAIQNKGELNYFIPALLNMEGIAYTGNPLEALFLTTSKRLTNKLLRQYGVRVPQAFSPSQGRQLTPGKKYILKPVWEEGSAGITAASVFTCDGGLPAAMATLPDGAWQIEEYIEGREFNISMLDTGDGPELLPFAEIIFRGYGEERPRIVDYHAKWSPGSFEYENTLREFPDLKGDPLLYQAISAAARATWECLELKGYARVDMRVDSAGNVFVLEANANPCISPDSGFTAAAARAGYSFPAVIQSILHHMNHQSYGNQN